MDHISTTTTAPDVVMTWVSWDDTQVVITTAWDGRASPAIHPDHSNPTDFGPAAVIMGLLGLEYQ